MIIRREELTDGFKAHPLISRPPKECGEGDGLPLAADPQAEVFRRYFLQYVPRVVVVRRDGSIAYQRSGYKELEGILELQEVVGRELRQAGR